MSIIISNHKIIKNVAGVIYEMHPYHIPEGIDIIIGKLSGYFDRTPDCGGNVEDTIKIFEWESWGDMQKWLGKFLMSIPEFRELNVSRFNKEKGIKFGDNNGIKFTDRYTRETQDERYTNFIDLNACIDNIVIAIKNDVESDEDCFLCEFAKEYGSMEPSDCPQCKECKLNPHLRYYRRTHPMAMKPKDQWTEEEKIKYDFD